MKCPNCRGVWLDKGELDKLIEKSAGYTDVPPPPPQQPYMGDSYKHNQGHYDPYYKHKKKKGFLGDFFDFD